MRADKQKKLEAAGFKVGNTEEFLGLSAEEMNYIEMRLALSRHVKQLRQKKRLSQAALATALKSSQSRVAKMESGDPSVSIDLLMRSLLSMGATRKEVARAMAA
jgi:predicted XRE-type DNA-binding protein